MERVASIEDLRLRAVKRLPKVMADFLDGGAGSEAGIQRNRQAFDEALLMPRYLVDISHRDQTAVLFGERHAAPFGCAPIGLANLIWPRAEQIMARVATSENLPFILSSAGTTSIEEIGRIGRGNIWFQLYPSCEDRITFDLMRRAEASGCPVLVVTVDALIPGRRDRDIRNGFGLPLRLGIRPWLDAATKPAWLAGTARHGLPAFANLARYHHHKNQTLAEFVASNTSQTFDWAALADIRRRWPHKLVVKGILDAADARRAQDQGADGIVVSNHGGRQLESAPATLRMLPQIRGAVGDTFPILLDSGIRSGGDIVKALAAGASFTLCGRPWLYGVAAGGERGAKRVIRILKQEVDLTLSQIGCSRTTDLHPGCLTEPMRHAASWSGKPLVAHDIAVPVLPPSR